MLYLTFWKTLRLKRTGYWATTPNDYLSLYKSVYLISLFPIIIFPVVGSYNLEINWRIVDFPHPLLPTNATLLPAGILKLKFSKTLVYLVGYLNDMF